MIKRTHQICLRALHNAHHAINIHESRRRCFATIVPKVHRRHMQCGSILTSDVANIGDADHFTLNKPNIISRISGQNAILTILVTPVFTDSALSPRLLTSILHRLHDIETCNLDVIIGIVDSLSDRDCPKIGDDGIGYIYQETTEELSTISQVPFSEHNNWRGHIMFSCQDQGTYSEIQVPLAPTVFYNGRVTTLVHQRWIYDASLSTLQKYDEREILTQKLCINTPDTLEMQSKLVALTPFRRVEACVGNIVRTLCSSEAAISYSEKPRKDALPASQELEEVVNMISRSHPHLLHHDGIWALVAPSWMFDSATGSARSAPLLASSTASLKDGWSKPGLHQQRSMIDESLSYILRGGGRLHRVLSGGGGWGKRAGLISLDPASDYDVGESNKGSVLFSDLGVPGTAINIEPTIHQGERIMYLASVDQTTSSAADALRWSPGIRFGTTIQEPAHPLPRRNAEEQHDYLGVLSTSGIGLRSRTLSGQVCSTKFDAPHSGISLAYK